MTEPPQQHAFQAEVSRILELMVHSVYTEKEIFLRELISNASDALDKLRYLALTDPQLTAEDGSELSILLKPDPGAKTLEVRDNGIGMSAAELVDNLGTIAHSGTKAFLDQMVASAAAGSGADLIGQFGVGFYSAFMVADRIEVVSRRAGTAEANRWISEGGGGFTVEPLAADEVTTTPRGTSVRLHLKADAQEFLKGDRIEQIVHAYSEHIQFPIRLAGGAEGEARQINSASALWTKPKAEITADQYTDFYRGNALQFDEPALIIHYKAEGRHDYAVLLFVPGSRPFDLYDVHRKGRIRLYVRRVFITDDADLLPAYLRFVRGVIDSQDMPLNISREMLQNNPLVASIRKAVTNRVLGELKTLAEKDGAGYEKVWTNFGAVLKEGLYEDRERRDALYDLARFHSTAGDGLRSLKDYVAALRENQKAIYYLTGESLEKLRASPQLEGYRARGVEVLMLTDPVDNFWVTAALGYEGKPFKSITQGDADIEAVPLADGAQTPAPAASDTAELIQALKRTLGAAVSDVKASTRLVESPACLVAPSFGPDRGLERIMARQADRPAATAPVLEINTGHRLVQRLEAARPGDRQTFEDLAFVLLDEARILEGSAPEEPGKFAERLNRLLIGGA